ncbi:hypothetical protein NHX12_022066 [Muraenolepis orangiensis]|uniref:Uncharacterized protein n=1 Tax=Muraenolepis orangiensis TaxID=630683 RepID=A0A9Q0IR10_9TELE|nr:hypothetical protein NHX12_022066 [Muraenolepis orangiensis]
MEQFKPPSPLMLTGNPSENWHRREQRFRLYTTASGASERKDEKVKVAILLHTIGEEALEVYNTLTRRWTEEDETMEDVLTALRDHCSPQKNVVLERHQCWSHQMTDGASMDTFITELRQKSKDSSAVLQQSTPQHVHRRLQGLRSRQQRYYNQHAGPLPELPPGSTVHMQTRRGWEPAVVMHERDKPRSYVVQTPSGKTFRRNRRHLRKIHPSLCVDTDPDEHSEVMFPQTPRPVGSPARAPPVSPDDPPAPHTRGGRVVSQPTRYRDGWMG